MSRDTTRLSASITAPKSLGGEHVGDRGAVGDLGPHLHDLAGHPAADHAGDNAVTFVERQELPTVVLDDVHGVVGLWLTEALDLDVVLVAPEIGHRDRRRNLP